MPTLYFKDISLDGSWSTAGHWFTDAAATIPAANAPWLADDAYKAYDLAYATGDETNVVINSNIGDGFTITGVCNLVVTNEAEINAGTFTRDGFYNSTGIIHGGVFSGDALQNNSFISGGDFSGDDVTNFGTINGGNFTGEDMVNDYLIDGGTFSGAFFVNSSGTMNGGTISGDYAINLFDINSGTSITGDNFNNTGTIYDGVDMSGDGWQNDGSIAFGTATNPSWTNFHNRPAAVVWMDTIYEGGITGDTILNEGIMLNCTVVASNFTNGAGGRMDYAKLEGENALNNGHIFGINASGRNFRNNGVIIIGYDNIVLGSMMNFQISGEAYWSCFRNGFGDVRFFDGNYHPDLPAETDQFSIVNPKPNAIDVLHTGIA